jgi:chorismate mutase
MSDKITQLRKEISSLDEEIIELLARRFHLTDQITEEKRSQNLSIEDLEREAESDSDYAELCLKKGLDPEMIIRIFNQIRKEVKSK